MVFSVLLFWSLNLVFSFFFAVAISVSNVFDADGDGVVEVSAHAHPSSKPSHIKSFNPCVGITNRVPIQKTTFTIVKVS